MNSTEKLKGEKPTHSNKNEKFKRVTSKYYTGPITFKKKICVLFETYVAQMSHTILKRKTTRHFKK